MNERQSRIMARAASARRIQEDVSRGIQRKQKRVRSSLAKLAEECVDETGSGPEATKLLKQKLLIGPTAIIVDEATRHVLVEYACILLVHQAIEHINKETCGGMHSPEPIETLIAQL